MPVKNGNTSEARMTLPELSADEVRPTSLPASPESSVLSRLLRMADNYRSANMLRQALEIYWDLAENHSSTPEAQQARQRLLAICEWYETQGKLHHARAMCQRMMNID